MAGPGGEQSALGQALSTLWKRRALVGALIVYTVFTVLMTQRLSARRGAQLTQPVDSPRAATRAAGVLTRALLIEMSGVSAGSPASAVLR